MILELTLAAKVVAVQKSQRQGYKRQLNNVYNSIWGHMDIEQPGL